ncbi:MAG: mechanosensitive ion channel [Bacteroidaceae bacterium]|nr:mechanosensitive ion channel [Bacteroidaceae bacterium]
MVLLAVQPAGAVLKERDLARTLGVLRAELAADYEKQQAFMARFEQQGAAQHQQLVWYMNQCEQIGLMLYSQSVDNTFDMAYACQQAVNLYRMLDGRNGRTLPYEKIITRMRNEIERYDALITSLKSMPPVDMGDEDVLSESDSILLNAIDSLESQMASTHVHEDGDLPPRPLEEAIGGDDEDHHEPLFLSGEQLADRRACLMYAQALQKNMQAFLENLEAESSYYTSVQEKVKQLNAFAQSRYKIIQDNIYKNGGSGYFMILADLPRYVRQATHSASTKYAPFRGKGGSYSEWRGVPVLFISIFVLFYLSLSLGLTYVVLRWLLPRRWRGESFKLRRQMLTNVIGIALFAIIVMVVRSLVDRNFIQMSTELIISMAWLLEVIFLSLYIRLKGEQMLHAALIYTPLMVLASVVIMLRIVLVPNSILNLLFPPFLLAFTLWQWWMVRRHRSALPLQDVIYSHVTTVVMVVSCVAAWVGYTLLSVQILVWWTFQLAAITTITCFYDLMEMFENRYMISRLCPQLKDDILAGEDVSEAAKPILGKMKHGKFITTTWLYDFINRTLVPILAVCSILVSIYWAAEIFEMTSICQKAFFRNFIDQKDLIQVSLFKLCLVAALWFLFSYLNYAVRSFYVYFRRKAHPDDQLNLTLAKNVIAILSWGLYFIIVLVILNVPKSGISIVTAGLATGLGFAMQDLIENFFYGLSLMTGRLRVGDYIECDGITGKVENISYQSTQIVTSDGCVIAFLNKALFSKNFKNMTRNHSYELIKIPVGVAYGTDVNEVRRLLVEAVSAVCEGMNATGQPIVDPARPVSVVFSDFGESSIDLFVCVWMLVEEKYGLSGRVKETIYETLNSHHIEIPFPQRDVHIVQH